jgi:hypothetical protein
VEFVLSFSSGGSAMFSCFIASVLHSSEDHFLEAESRLGPFQYQLIQHGSHTLARRIQGAYNNKRMAGC